MACKTFGKDSKERQFFVDLWEFCQKYWIAEDTELYWDSIRLDIEKFLKKHDGDLSARWMADFLIEKEKEIRGE